MFGERHLVKGNPAMFASRIHTLVASIALVAFALTAIPAFAEEVKVPQTAAEHEARAKAYKEQAAQYRKSAEEHKQMAAAYAAKRPDIKGVGKNPAAAKMSKHCLTLAKDFEKLATDAEKMAEFHEMRAKEAAGG
jgi:nitrate reductase cytochrome c-type subunit